MLGFPPGWVDGIPRTAQLRCLGNTVQPQVAEMAARVLLAPLMGLVEGVSVGRAQRRTRDVTDYVTAEEAQRILEYDVSLYTAPKHRELATTVIHQAELLAEAREALQQVDRGWDVYMNSDVWVDEMVPAIAAARAALARLDSQESK